MEDVSKKGHEGLLLLAELAKQAATMGNIGNLYTERYLNKGPYIEKLNKQEFNGSWSALIVQGIFIKCFG